MYMSIDVYMIIWLYEYVCCEIVSVLYVCVWLYWLCVYSVRDMI